MSSTSTLEKNSAPAASESLHKMDLLRFTTAGSVDDGKSTLIGRMLFDSKSIFEDQMEALERSAEITGGSDVNLANLTDGLRAEREQGITIDVAYRYFATPRRRFIIADTPGHAQYTRNMVTGASTANLALILVDARKGVSEQSKRHAYLASLLRIPHVVVCINKMDLVDFSEERYEQVRDEFMGFVPRLGLPDVTFIPVSALQGDNVVDPSENMDWYRGATLLGHLETVYIGSDFNLSEFRMPVQWVNRPGKDEFHDFRGFSGQITGGVVKVGDSVVALPSGYRSKVKEIHTYDGNLEEAGCPRSVTLRLEDEIDITRGDVIVGEDRLPIVAQQHIAEICWMNQQPLALRKKYMLRQGTSTVQAMISSIDHRIDMHDLGEIEDPTELNLNDIGRIRFKTSKPLVYDSYRRNRMMGSFILIDPATHDTVAAGMLKEPENRMPVSVLAGTEDFVI